MLHFQQGNEIDFKKLEIVKCYRIDVEILWGEREPRLFYFICKEHYSTKKVLITIEPKKGKITKLALQKNYKAILDKVLASLKATEIDANALLTDEDASVREFAKKLNEF